MRATCERRSARRPAVRPVRGSRCCGSSSRRPLARPAQGRRSTGIQPCQLEGEEREVARVLFGNVDTIPESARRTLVWRLGRGSGKTTIAAALGVWVMLTAPLGSIGPGMTPAVVTVAPGKANAKVSVAVGRELVRRVPSLERLVCDDGDTADGFSLRRPDGRRVSFVVRDSGRFEGRHDAPRLRHFGANHRRIRVHRRATPMRAPATGTSVNDRDLYNAAKPRLHGPAVFISHALACGEPHRASSSTRTLVVRSPRLRPSASRRPCGPTMSASRATSPRRSRTIPTATQRESICASRAPAVARACSTRRWSTLRSSRVARWSSSAPRGFSRRAAGGDLGLESDSSADRRRS